MPEVSPPLTTGVYVNTTNATETTAATRATKTNKTYLATARIVATETDDFDESAGYIISGVFQNDGGTLALVGSLSKTVVAEDTAGWDATIDANSTNIRVRVTGAASTNITWKVSLTIDEVGKYVAEAGLV